MGILFLSTRLESGVEKLLGGRATQAVVSMNDKNSLSFYEPLTRIKTWLAGLRVRAGASAWMWRHSRGSAFDSPQLQEAYNDHPYGRQARTHHSAQERPS